jgi:hypothetical protein
VDHDVKDAAVQCGIRQEAVRTWLYKLRHQLRDEQSAINKIRTLQRISPRVRKLTTCGEVPEPEPEEGIIAEAMRRR